MWNHLVDRFGRFGWAQSQRRHSHQGVDCEMEELECRCSIPLYKRRSGVATAKSLEDIAAAKSRRHSLGAKKSASLWRLSNAKSQEDHIGRFHQHLRRDVSGGLPGSEEDNVVAHGSGGGGSIGSSRSITAINSQWVASGKNEGKYTGSASSGPPKGYTILLKSQRGSIQTLPASLRTFTPFGSTPTGSLNLNSPGSTGDIALWGASGGGGSNNVDPNANCPKVGSTGSASGTQPVKCEGSCQVHSRPLESGSESGPSPPYWEKPPIPPPREVKVPSPPLLKPLEKHDQQNKYSITTSSGQTFKSEGFSSQDASKSTANSARDSNMGSLGVSDLPPPPSTSSPVPPPVPPRRIGGTSSFRDFQRGDISPVLPPRRRPLSRAHSEHKPCTSTSITTLDHFHLPHPPTSSLEALYTNNANISSSSSSAAIQSKTEDKPVISKVELNDIKPPAPPQKVKTLTLYTPTRIQPPSKSEKKNQEEIGTTVSEIGSNHKASSVGFDNDWKRTSTPVNIRENEYRSEYRKDTVIRSSDSAQHLLDKPEDHENIDYLETVPLSPDPQQKQLQAYVAWVNSQLKKKPGTRTVEDLRDMQDGVALADLIEIVANVPLPGIYGAPSTAVEMVANVDKVLEFMTSHRIRMHQTTAPDIVEGNLKSIMRLILALAAHYKPKSVKHSHQPGAGGAVSPRSHPTLIGLAQGAAAALADARRDASIVHQRPQRPLHLVQESRFQGSGSESEVTQGDPERGEQLQVLRCRERGELEGASCGSSPRSSVPGSPKANRRLNFGAPKSPNQEFDSGHHRNEEVHDACDTEADPWQELSEEQNGLVHDMEVTKRALLQLQKLLLSGQQADGQEDPESKPCEGATAEEQLVVLKSQCQQTEEMCRDLREELSRVKNDAMQLQGTKAGLQKRLAEQDEAFLKMKAEMLRVGFSQQSLQTEKSDLERKVLEQDRLIHDLRRELHHRDQQIEELVASLQFQQQDKDMTTRALHTQIVDLHEKLQLVGETEASLSHRVASQDRKMALLEGKLLHTQFDGHSRPSSARSHQSGNSDDLQAMRDSLQSLRTSFAGNDPTHHTIDTLERSISGLMDRLQLSEASRLSDSLNMSSRHHYNYDSTGDIRRSPISSHIPGINRLDSSSSSNNSNQGTKVLYFTDRAVTPFMCSIQKRLGEICLRDFKEMYDRHGNYRYHFKAMDPEFGTVKEEITNDDDIIPGWEGKIVAWIEEDHG